MRNALTTTRTYATYANALKALDLQVAAAHREEISYVIATTPGGRFAPVVFGSKYVYLAHKGIMVIAHS